MIRSASPVPGEGFRSMSRIYPTRLDRYAPPVEPVSLPKLRVRHHHRGFDLPVWHRPGERTSTSTEPGRLERMASHTFQQLVS
jgi:hypothetical protein